MQKRHWSAWLLACAMALVPLVTWILVHYMIEQHPVIRAEATRELIFFGVSTLSNSVIALVDVAPGIWSRILLYASLFFTISAAVAYGALLTGEALHAAARLRGAYDVSMIIAVVAFFVSAAVQFLTQWRRSNVAR
jgi:hypothetical protein